MTSYLTFWAVSGLVLCTTLAANITLAPQSVEMRYGQPTIGGSIQGLELQQRGSIDYLIPVLSRQVSIDTQDAVKRAF